YVLAGYSNSTNSGNKTTGSFGDHDWWVVKLAARVAPVGAPVVLVNGLCGQSNMFFIPATNTASVTLTSTFPGGHIYYTLDGSVPVPGENAIKYSSPGNLGTPFIVTNSVVVNAIAYRSDETGNVEASADPVTIHV